MGATFYSAAGIGLMVDLDDAAEWTGSADYAEEDMEDAVEEYGLTSVCVGGDRNFFLISPEPILLEEENQSYEGKYPMTITDQQKAMLIHVAAKMGVEPDIKFHMVTWVSI